MKLRVNKRQKAVGPDIRGRIILANYLVMVISDGITIKVSHGVDVLLYQPVLHPIFSYWDG